MLRHLESKLKDEESRSCEGPLSPDDCLLALKGMSRNKTPGSDGLPMEFYLTFWDVLSADLVEVLNFSHSCGSLSTSQRRGFISLVPKKGDLRLRKNWRPITLLNVDYKIASRTISARLLRVLHLIVSPDQTGSVPGRFIGETVILLQNISDFATLRDIPTALISLDQEKAFDRVDWPFLFKTLQTMGFGPSFIQWVKTFYNGVVNVQVNGFFTPFFSLSRGVRQGCPLSPLLYIISAEVLASNIRACPRIKGFPLPGSPPVSSAICQYADDTTLTVITEDSILAIFDIYSLYEDASGAKLNQDKSKGLWLGPWANRTDQPVPLLWSSHSIPCLGVSIAPNVHPTKNWDKRISSLSNVFDLWQQRCLSFQGKALVANALALSGLWYSATVLSLPNAFLKSVNSSLYKFIWSNKKELVSRNSMFLSKDQGGFNVVNVDLKVKALHVQWLKRFFLSPNKWCRFFEYYVSNFLHDDLLEVAIFPCFLCYYHLAAFLCLNH